MNERDVLALALHGLASGNGFEVYDLQVCREFADELLAPEGAVSQITIERAKDWVAREVAQELRLAASRIPFGQDAAAEWLHRRADEWDPNAPGSTT